VLQREAAYISEILLPLLGPAAAAAAEAAAEPAPAAATPADGGRGAAGPDGAAGAGEALQLQAVPAAANQMEVPQDLAALLESEGRRLAPGVVGQLIPDHTLLPAGGGRPVPACGRVQAGAAARALLRAAVRSVCCYAVSGRGACPLAGIDWPLCRRASP
jgi:hypothetical protein